MSVVKGINCPQLPCALLAPAPLRCLWERPQVTACLTPTHLTHPKNTNLPQRKRRSRINYGNQLHTLLKPGAGRAACRAGLRAERAPSICKDLPSCDGLCSATLLAPRALLRGMTALGGCWTPRGAPAYKKAHKKLL